MLEGTTGASNDTISLLSPVLRRDAGSKISPASSSARVAPTEGSSPRHVEPSGARKRMIRVILGAAGAAAAVAPDSDSVLCFLALLAIVAVWRRERCVRARHADSSAQDITTISCARHRMWAQDVAVHILCAHRVAQDMTATSCKFGPIILCGAQDVAGCAQDMVCRILCAAQDKWAKFHRMWQSYPVRRTGSGQRVTQDRAPRSCARHRMWAQDVAGQIPCVQILCLPDPVCIAVFYCVKLCGVRVAVDVAQARRRLHSSSFAPAPGCCRRVLLTSVLNKFSGASSAWRGRDPAFPARGCR